MSVSMSTWQLLAEAAPVKVADPNAQLLQYLPFVAVAVLFYMMLIRPQKREAQQRQAMLAALKKNDRVVTVGGIIGTVANLTPDGKEVMLKVDDNTKLRLLRSSIQTVLTSDPAPGDAAAGS